MCYGPRELQKSPAAIARQAAGAIGIDFATGIRLSLLSVENDTVTSKESLLARQFSRADSRSIKVPILFRSRTLIDRMTLLIYIKLIHIDLS